MKRCNHCKEKKSFAEFGRLKSSGDGYRGECRECRKRYWQKPPEEIEKWRAWRKEHMRQMGLNSKGRKVSAETKKRKKQTDAIRWKVHDYSLSAKKRVHYNYKRKGFEGTLEVFVKLVTQNCHYCGTEPDKITGTCRNTKHGVGSFKHLGLDRIDNLKGYELKNVVPCCWRCNNAKWTYGYEDFRKWIKRVHKTFSKR